MSTTKLINPDLLVETLRRRANDLEKEAKRPVGNGNTLIGQGDPIYNRVCWERALTLREMADIVELIAYAETSAT